jgi:hypothetical protein
MRYAGGNVAAAAAVGAGPSTAGVFAAGGADAPQAAIDIARTADAAITNTFLNITFHLSDLLLFIALPQ